ncbi:hypothetical protein VNO78_24183 [Psophocarpus tetragonolobus]|uniref:CBF1-interacting co-repressor CIR N-terminal domain-containing protein n=1 Tax=Psophocarpus tetragonolobus TaxID=3891 RepID=A0AAN9S7Z7_PSOTE
MGCGLFVGGTVRVGSAKHSEKGILCNPVQWCESKMGGHGGLNILPQKRWNVYNYDNREKVRRDEEQAAKEEQLKREQARKRDAEFRLHRLRSARGLAPSIPTPESEPKTSSDPAHINLFDGINIFDPILKTAAAERDDGTKKRKEGGPKPKPQLAPVVGPEDEKYRLGYGLAGKGVQLPWYVRKPDCDGVDVKDESGDGDRRENTGEKKRKTMEELREERLKRERKEKDRERALRHDKMPSHRDASGSRRKFSR